MIRPFHLRDLALVHRLSERGVSLHTESALTRNVNPVRGALLGIVGGEFPTFVWKSEDRSVVGFIQLCLAEDSPLAHILYLSGMGETAVSQQNNGDTGVDEHAWLPLLDQAVVEVGRRGIHSLVAEVDEIGPEFPILRRAGFVVYTRQDIWLLPEYVPQNGAELLRPRQESDDWDIHLLYANTVPRLVQMVEPMPPLDDGTGWVLREDGELAAFVHVLDGPAATWMRLFVHPNAEARVEEILSAVLHLKSPKLVHPIYCCVRRYQSWIQGSLARAGFVLWGSQAVMVKHTVHHAPKPTAELSLIRDVQPVSPTTPMVRPYQRESVNSKQ
jgi:hypothetical protein